MLFPFNVSMFSLSTRGNQRLNGGVLVQGAVWDISHVVRAPGGAHICLQLSASRGHHCSRWANETHALTAVKGLELSLAHIWAISPQEARGLKGAHSVRTTYSNRVYGP
ncbi:hypothetical protein AMECASPLE_011222 [Ameca splendens]|uniref:Uncharacterized protein n=1 Tax=Ameca splendens TaxID=208324 RepID=A0ABV0Z9K3_9TELE